MRQSLLSSHYFILPFKCINLGNLGNINVNFTSVPLHSTIEYLLQSKTKGSLACTYDLYMNLRAKLFILNV